MEQPNRHSLEEPQQELTITRVLKYPMQEVYFAWTKPDLLAQWWGPEGFTNPVCELDLKPGGEIHIDMKAPDGTIYPMQGIYHEIIEPEKIVFTSTAFKNAEGKWQLEVFNSVTMDHEGDNTRLSLKAVIVTGSPEVESSVAGMQPGWEQSFDRLEALLKNSTLIEEKDNTKLEP